jgi:hypothetical protein
MVEDLARRLPALCGGGRGGEAEALRFIASVVAARRLAREEEEAAAAAARGAEEEEEVAPPPRARRTPEPPSVPLKFAPTRAPRRLAY